MTLEQESIHSLALPPSCFIKSIFIISSSTFCTSFETSTAVINWEFRSADIFYLLVHTNNLTIIDSILLLLSSTTGYRNTRKKGHTSWLNSWLAVCSGMNLFRNLQPRNNCSIHCASRDDTCSRFSCKLSFIFLSPWNSWSIHREKSFLALETYLTSEL